MQILLVISGSIASYKALDFIREMNKRNHNITCVISKAGEKFITSLATSYLSGNLTYTNDNFFQFDKNMPHIHLARKADIIVVLPATADIMAKVANGISDELVTTVLIATDVPIIMVPAMNTVMWNAKSTQRNVQRLKEDGVKIVGPIEGLLACGEYGTGQMEDINKVITEIENTPINK